MELEKIKDLAKTGNYSEALLLLDDLIRINSKEDKLWAARAFVNTHQGNSEAAIDDWSKAIQLNKEPHYFYMRGISRFQVSQYRSAISDFTAVIELCDKYKSDYYRSPAYFFRADAYLRLGEFDQAKSDCVHVPDNTQTWTDKLRTKADILAECS